MAQKGKGQDNSSWISVVDSVITDVKSTMNGLDFLDSPQGPRITLLPVQRILFKAILGIPMDYKEQRVPVWDDFRENILCTLKETEYIAYEHSKGKINFADWRDLPARGFNECLIIAGRRGGKSQLVSALATEKLRQLLSIRSPQLHYRLVDGSPIDFTLLAQDEDGAERLYNKIKADVNRAEFFRPYLYGKAGTDSVKFITEADRFRRDVEPSIEVASWPCTF